MNNEKWNKVLIEWVNCLKLCKSINEVEELRSGEFFSNLQKVVTKSRNAQLDILTFIFDLFTKHYPNYSFENKTEIHLSDLPETDLKALTSLLMHYTCIYDRTDVLTSPLCHSLSQSTQLIIRNFLQKIAKDVSRVAMDDIIKSCIDDASDHLTNHHWLSVDSSSAKNSPLQDLLKTPISKFGRLQEKDRIIAKLKTELEAERFDKAELQEDLKRQVEKNKKIELQISQKTNEIVRLRAEVVALENRTPPHYQDMDSRELQRRLRSEIQSLEQYIKQIENEQEEIVKERDAVREQARKLESQAQIWEEKFFETERNFEILKENSKQQEDELVELQAHCAEITALLDEYRKKPENDSSLYDTFTSISNVKSLDETPPCEDLACSVVEVQLRDAQKLNEELKFQIREYEEREEQLKETLGYIEADKERSEEKCEELASTVRSLEAFKETLQQSLLQVQTDLKESEQKSQLEITKLSAELNDASVTLSKLSTTNEELASKVTSLESCREDIENRLSETLVLLETEKRRSQNLENDRNTAKSISDKLQFELADVVLHNQKLVLELDDLKQQNELLIAKLEDTESSNKLLETHLHDSRQSLQVVSALLERTQWDHRVLRSTLDECRAEFDREKEELISTINNTNEKFGVLQKTNEELKSEISNLHNQLREALERIESEKAQTKQMEEAHVVLEKDLEDAQYSMKKLQCEISDLRREKEEIVGLLDDANSKLGIVEQEKLNLQIRRGELEELQLKLSVANEELSTQVETLQTQLQEADSALEIKSKEILNLQESCEALEIEVDKERTSATQHQEEANRNNAENFKLQSKLEDVEQNYATLTKEKEDLNLDHNKLKEELAELQKEMQSLIDTRNSLEAQLTETRGKFEETSADLHQLKNEKENVSEELQVSKDSIRKIEEERTALASQLDESIAKCHKIEEELSMKVENLHKQLKSYNDTLKFTETELLELKKVKTALETELLEERNLAESLASELGKVRIENLQLDHDTITLQKEREDLTKKLGTLEKQNADLLLQKQKTEEVLNEATKKLEAVESELRDLEENKIDLQVLLNEANASIERLKTELSNKRRHNEETRAESIKLEAQKVELERLLRELKTAHEDLESKLRSSEESSEERKREIQKLLQENEDLENTKTRCVDLEKEKDSLAAELQSSLQKNEEFTVTVENLQRQLSEDRKTITDAKHAEVILQQKLIDFCAVLESAKIDKQKTNEDLMNVRNQNQILIAKLEDYEVKCLQLEQKVTEVINNLIVCNQESEEVRKTLEDNKIALNMKVFVLEENLATLEAKLLTDKSEVEKQKELYENTISETKEYTQTLIMEKEQIRKELENEKGKLTANLEDLEAKLKESEEEKDKLSLQNQNLEERVVELATTEEQLVIEKQQYQEALADLLKEKEQLEENFLVLEDASKKLQHENESIVRLKEEVGKEKAELELTVSAHHQQIEKLQRQKEHLRTQLCALETNYKQLKTTKDITDRQLEEVSILSETLKAEAEEVRLQYQKSMKELNDTRDLLVRITNEKEEIIKNLKETKEGKDELLGNLELSLAAMEANSKEIITKLTEEKEALVAKSEQREGELEKLKAEVEETTNRAESAEDQLENTTKEVLSLNDQLDRLSSEKSLLDKKIEVEELISSENRDRAKTLEETVQDYEITISGLKNVVDTNLEQLESLKDELSERKNKEVEIRNTINKMLEQNNMSFVEIDEDFKLFISSQFDKVLRIKNEEEKRIVDLENEIKELKNRNLSAVDLSSTVTEMVEKLYALVTEQEDVSSMASMKARFDDVHSKVNNLLQVKQQLSEELRNVKIDKEDLKKQLDAIKQENDALSKTKSEIEENLKVERSKVETLRKELETRPKSIKVEKENILGVSTKSNKSREDELKKENMMLKRKIVLAENAKNNLEKVLKQLREEKKRSTPPSPDVLYKKLLQEYIQVKEENEQVLKERDARIAELTNENEELKNIPMRPEDDKKLHNIREAYGKLMSVNSKLELEMVTLRKIIEERNSEMADLAHIKEAYEKLLEENNKIITEVDTLKYKRNRDKEEFVRLLKKDRETSDSREMKRIQEIRNEYEGKLEKMKEKMLKLYREEVNKKVKSLKDGHNETATLLKTVGNLRSELFEAEQRIQLLEMEKEMLKANQDVRTVQLQSTITSLPDRSATFPRQSINKEFTISRTSVAAIPNLPMEDEEDLFNDKYLTDLKEGKCNFPDRNARFSELAWRNSMVPPHLKSSYPAETQFASPGRFKDDDIKTGNIELEDSLCKLLPGEKPRKKDFGTTSYKKPGPPTPSKNGGRLSLQGNEVHPMREHCETKTPKRSTPSRIKALFTGRNSSTMKDISESQTNGTPSRGKRLNIFRRPR